MNKVRILLDPVRRTMAGFTVVGGFTVKLLAGGPQAGAVTTSPQPATLEFFELPASGDAARAPRLVYSIEGAIVDNKGVPLFDSGGNFARRRFSHFQSDFFLDIAFDASNFNLPFIGPDFTDALRLPWDSSAAEGTKMEIGAKLTVAGTVEANTSLNGPLDIPTRHLNVPEDGATGNQAIPVCIGVGTVYPTQNSLLTAGLIAAGQRIRFAGNTMNVFINEDVGKGINSRQPGSFVLQEVAAALAVIMQDAGFGAPNVEEVAWSDPALTSHWMVNNSQVIATGNSTTIPFFDYWMFFDRSTGGHGPHAAQSEKITVVSTSATTKDVASPIVLFGRRGENFDNTLQQTDTTDAPKLVATIIAHEIGHSLGLLHGMRFHLASGTYSVANRIGTMTGGFVDGGHAIAQTFGPIHKDVLKALYL